MIVKVVSRTEDQSRFFDVGEDVTGGKHWFDEPEEERDLLVLKGPYPEAECAYTFFALDDEPTPRCTGPNGEPMWVTRFVRWWDAVKERHEIVVTSGTIYLLSDKGDTIERVH